MAKMNPMQNEPNRPMQGINKRQFVKWGALALLGASIAGKIAWNANRFQNWKRNASINFLYSAHQTTANGRLYMLEADPRSKRGKTV